MWMNTFVHEASEVLVYMEGHISEQLSVNLAQVIVPVHALLAVTLCMQLKSCAQMQAGG